MWGKGIYFAVNASYSCSLYSYKVPNLTGVYEVFLANVVTGNEIDVGINSNSTLLKPPPMEDNPNMDYDSVKGNT